MIWGFVKMISKWVIVLIFAAAILSTAGSSLDIRQEMTGTALDPSLGSTSPAAQASPASVAGSWSLTLVDAATGRARSVNVEICQIDDVIFGLGGTSDGDGSAFPVETEPRPTKDEGIESMIWWLHQETEPGAATTTARSLSIGASGLVRGASLSLDLVFLEENVLRRLDLVVAGNSITGSYLAYDSLGRVESGRCYGYIRAGYGMTTGSGYQVIPLGGMRSH